MDVLLSQCVIVRLSYKQYVLACYAFSAADNLLVSETEYQYRYFQMWQEYPDVTS